MQVLDRRPKRAGLMLWRTIKDNLGVRHFAKLHAKRLKQAGFADAGFSLQQHSLAFAFHRVLPPPGQKAEFGLAADEWGQGLSASGLKAVGRGAGAQHPIDRNRCANALEHLWAKRVNLKEALHEAQRRLAHDQATRRCKGLQTCGNIWRFANDAVTKALLANSQFTDNNRASVDTAAGFETICPKLRQSGHDVEARLDCALSGILVGRRITEIGGHAIADEKTDLPFMALNHLCAYLLKGQQQISQIFRI